MTIFDRKRLKVQKHLEEELSRISCDSSSSEYWNVLQEIYERHDKELKQIDSSERTYRSLKEAESPHATKKSEYQTQVDSMKVYKLNSLISKISQSNHVEVSLDDPFYEDKVHPLQTFENWWSDFISMNPPIEECSLFLSRVDIDSNGWIIFNENLCKSVSPILNKQRSTSNKRDKEIQKCRKRLRSPLLKNSTKSKYSEEIYRYSIQSFGLSSDIEDLLLRHSRCCFDKGLINQNDYITMVGNFLYHVESDIDREKIILEAISRNWRVLSDGSF